MARVTGDQVKEIIDTTLTAEEVVPFIAVATALVTARCAEAYPAAILFEIERWLTAHFISGRDLRLKSESVLGVSATYFGADGSGLDSSTYGQRVRILDYLGCLNDKPAAGIEWLGIATA